MSAQRNQIYSHYENLGYTEVRMHSTDSRKYDQVRGMLNGELVIIPITEAKKAAGVVAKKREVRNGYISADMGMLAMMSGLRIR